MVGCCVELVAGLCLQRLASCSLFLNLGGLMAVLAGGSREPSKLGRQQNKSSQVSLQDPAAGCQLFCAGVPVQLQHTLPVTEASNGFANLRAKSKPKLELDATFGHAGPTQHAGVHIPNFQIETTRANSKMPYKMIRERSLNRKPIGEGSTINAYVVDQHDKLCSTQGRVNTHMHRHTQTYIYIL